MNLSCSSRMIKYLMFAFNLFFVISGIIIIAVGATVKTVYSEYSDFLDSKYFTLPNMLIATGAMIFFISFLGCCGSIKESWIMLGVFSILLCVIFIFEFSAGIAGYVLRDRTMNYLDEKLKATLKTYQDDTHDIWDSVQRGFQCCGVNSYMDWRDIFPNYSLPVSCCRNHPGAVGVFYCNSYIDTTTESSDGTTSSITIISTTPAPVTSATSETTLPPTSPPTAESTAASTESSTTPSPAAPEVRRKRAVEDQNPDASTTVPIPPPSSSKPYNAGCKPAFGNYVKRHAVQIGGCALALAIIQLLGIVFSCHLVRQMKNGYYST